MSLQMQMPPSSEDAILARASSAHLARYIKKDQPLKVRLSGDEAIELPSGAVELLIGILKMMASGRAMTLIPANAELTTVQASEILNVSRPFLVKLLEKGEIPHRKVGKHRRINIEDVIRYKQRIDTERKDVLDQLVADAQEQGMGYGP